MTEDPPRSGVEAWEDNDLVAYAAAAMARYMRQRIAPVWIGSPSTPDDWRKGVPSGRLMSRRTAA